jgi:hypothetical protein
MAAVIGSASYDAKKDKVLLNTDLHLTVVLIPNKEETNEQLIMRMREDREWRKKVMFFEGTYGKYAKLNQDIEVLDL